MATDVLDGRSDQRNFGVIDIGVRRNAWGRQVDSFEADLRVSGIEGSNFPAVFIRAPRVERVGDDVEVLAAIDDEPVLCRSGSDASWPVFTPSCPAIYGSISCFSKEFQR